MIAGQINRAQLLIHQNRFDEAEQILGELMSQAPDNTMIMGMYVEVLIEKEDNKAALEVIERAIGLEPDNDLLYYTKARVLLGLEHYDKAEKMLAEAIQLDPNDDDYHALWASVKLTRKQYEQALEKANYALDLNAENLLALNTRSTALLKLDQPEDSFETIKEALGQNPNNAFTHANFGWNLLEKGDHKAALEHFSEALKLDPNFEIAQAGMSQALKARYFFYRLFLKYSFWIGNLSSNYQWAFIIGFYFAFRFLRQAAESMPAIRPFVVPILVLMGLFAFSTWVVNPIANLFFRFNKYGKHLLSKDEKMSSNFVAISAFLAVLGLLGFVLTGLGRYEWLTLSGYGLIMMIPCSVLFTESKPKHLMKLITAILTVIGLYAVYISFTTYTLFNGASLLFVFGVFGVQILANFILIRKSNV